MSGDISADSGGFSPLTLKAFPGFCLLGKIENQAQIVLGDCSGCYGKRTRGIQGLLQGDIFRKRNIKGKKVANKDGIFTLSYISSGGGNYATNRMM